MRERGFQYNLHHLTLHSQWLYGSSQVAAIVSGMLEGCERDQNYSLVGGWRVSRYGYYVAVHLIDKHLENPERYIPLCVLN